MSICRARRCARGSRPILPGSASLNFPLFIWCVERVTFRRRCRVLSRRLSSGSFPDHCDFQRHCLRQTRSVWARERERRSNPVLCAAVWIASLVLAMTNWPRMRHVPSGPHAPTGATDVMSKKPSQSLSDQLKPYVAPFRFDGSGAFHLRSRRTNDKGGLDKDTAEKILEANRKRLNDFQERLYAQD